ncbi:MAG: hypothetical protein RLZZ163_1124 [Actinomycetota bacterium]|jgi:hypothetical protein
MRASMCNLRSSPMGHPDSTLAFAADWTDHPAFWNRTNSTLGLSDVSPAFVDRIG